MIILGGIEDQLTALVWGKVSASFFSLVSPLNGFAIYEILFRDYLHPLSSNQPIIWFYLSIFLTTFGPGFYNFFLFQTGLLNFICSYLFFKQYKFGLCYALLFTFSSYFWTHFGVHPSLIQLWVIPLFLYFYFKYSKEFVMTRSNILLLSLLISLTILVDNYLGFILLIFLFCHTVAKFLVTYLESKVFKLAMFLNMAKILIITFLITIPFLYTFIQANYLSKDESNIKSVSRPYEDFFTFSLRPWYFFMPSPKHALMGSISKAINNHLVASTYYLADDYFPREHQGAFFGFALTFTFLFLMLRINRINLSLNEKSTTKTLLLTLIFIFFLTMPPYVTLLGFKIYMPSYFLFQLFPMFRVTARFSVIMQFLVLIFVATFLNKLLSAKTSKKLNLFIVVLTVLTLFETYIPLKVINISRPPESYEYLNTLKEQNLVVYPYNKTAEALYWADVHKKYLLNPRDFRNKEYTSEKFSASLISTSAEASLNNLNVEILLVYKSISDTELEFFSKANFLKLDVEYNDVAIYKVVKSKI